MNPHDLLKVLDGIAAPNRHMVTNLRTADICGWLGRCPGLATLRFGSVAKSGWEAEVAAKGMLSAAESGWETENSYGKGMLSAAKRGWDMEIATAGAD